MEYVNSTSFRNHLDRFLRRAGQGETFIVTLFGKPLAFVGSWQKAVNPQSPGPNKPLSMAGLLKDVPDKTLTGFDRHSKRRPLFQG